MPALEVGFYEDDGQEEDWEPEDDWTAVVLGAMKGKGKAAGGKAKGKGKSGSKGFQGSCWTCGQFGHSRRDCSKGGKCKK